MKVLLVPTATGLVGGHTTQLVETQLALRRAGISVETGTVGEVNAERWDIVHAFGDIRPLLQQRIPLPRLVVSPLYFPRSVVLGPVFRGGTRGAKLYVSTRHWASHIRRREEWRRRLNDFHAMHLAWERADVVIVNSAAEARLLQRDAIDGYRDVRVAYSGVGQMAFGGEPRQGRRLIGIGDDPFVLSVGRIEPRKNQLSLALALRDLSLRLVLVGEVLPGNERYFSAVRKAAPEVIHVPHLEHEDLRHVYAAAAVHALPSWFETTGLVTLEALAAGTPVVVDNGPCPLEYFSGCAATCDPADVRSIHRAIASAAQKPLGCERARARRFSWDNTAEDLIYIYHELTDRVT
jgi:glycosyltransferase involved in cell wall biosynthesis